MIAEERLSRELDEAIEQQHFAREAYHAAIRKVFEAREALDAVTGRKEKVVL